MREGDGALDFDVFGEGIHAVEIRLDRLHTQFRPFVTYQFDGHAGGWRHGRVRVSGFLAAAGGSMRPRPQLWTMFHQSETIREGAMKVTTAILVCLQAKHGEQHALEGILRDAAPAAREDTSLLAWVALRFGSHEYGVFAAFAEAGTRDAYAGGTLAAFLRDAGLHLDQGVKVQKLDVVSWKLPCSLPAQPDTKALLLNFKARENGAEAVEAFLRESRSQVKAEEETTAWFAVRDEAGAYSLFATFADSGGRLKNLVGYVPSQLARQALHLLGSMPDMDMLDVIASKVECEDE
jgi:hypothetical protein